MKNVEFCDYSSFNKTVGKIEKNSSLPNLVFSTTFLCFLELSNFGIFKQQKWFQFECCGVKSYADWLSASWDRKGLSAASEDGKMEHGIGSVGGGRGNGFGKTFINILDNCFDKNAAFQTYGKLFNARIIAFQYAPWLMEKFQESCQLRAATSMADKSIPRIAAPPSIKRLCRPTQSSSTTRHYLRVNDFWKEIFQGCADVLYDTVSSNLDLLITVCVVAGCIQVVSE